MAHNEPPHQDLRCLQIHEKLSSVFFFFFFLVVKVLSYVRENIHRNNIYANLFHQKQNEHFYTSLIIVVLKWNNYATFKSNNLFHNYLRSIKDQQWGFANRLDIDPSTHAGESDLYLHCLPQNFSLILLQSLKVKKSIRHLRGAGRGVLAFCLPPWSDLWTRI